MATRSDYDPYKRLAAGILVSAVNRIKREWIAHKPLAKQHPLVWCDLAFLLSGGKDYTHPEVIHRLAGAEFLLEMSVDDLLTHILGADLILDERVIQTQYGPEEGRRQDGP